MCMKIADGKLVDSSFVDDDHVFGDWDDGSKHCEMMIFSLSRAQHDGYGWEHEQGT